MENSVKHLNGNKAFAYRYPLTVIIVILCSLSAYLCHAAAKNSEKISETGSSKTSAVFEEGAKKESADEQKVTSSSFGLFPMGELQEIVRRERVATLSEIDKERQATLHYMTQERVAVMEDIRNELRRITEILQAERQKTMLDIDTIGNRIAENTVLLSKQLIDHFFIRLVQGLGTIAIIVVGFIIFRKTLHRRSAPSCE